MKICVLGPLTVTDESGVPLDLPLEPKQEVVLLALAANADRGISLRELVVAVYGSTETVLYKRSVESLVSRLRATLRTNAATDAAILPRAKASFYTAALSADQVDALRFLRLAERLLRDWTAMDTAERQMLSRQALAEWRDNPVRIYGGVCPVAADVFRRFTATLADLGQRYVRLLLEVGDLGHAKRESTRLVELLPGHVQLEQLHAEVHDRAAFVSVPTAEPARDGEDEPAVQELYGRLRRSRSLPLDAIAVTAHNFDRIHLVDRVAPDHEARIELALDEAGGSGANTVAALARLGVAVAAAGIVADDAEGVTLLGALARAGVDPHGILVVPAGDGVHSGRSLIFSDPHGVRSIYVQPGVNESLAAAVAETPGALRRLEEAVARSRIVHLTSFTAPAELGLQEHLASVLPPESVLSLNPGALYASLGLDRLDRILSRANTLFLYEQNLRELVDNSAAPAREAEEPGIRRDLSRLYAWKRMRGHDQPLVTLVKRHRSEVSGEHWPEYLTLASGRFGLEEIIGTQARIGPRNQPPVKDSTGAGDGMAAGLYFGLLGGASLRECADLSFLVATMVSDHVGARAGHPTPEELRSAWHTHFPGVPEPGCLTAPRTVAVSPRIKG